MKFWLIRLTVFFISTGAVYCIVKSIFMKKKNSSGWNYPEIMAVSVIAGSVITGLVMFVLKNFI